MLQDNMKEIEMKATYYPNDSMCVYVSECYDFINPFFQCERNKSPCRNSALMYVYVNHRSRVFNMPKMYSDMKCKKFNSTKHRKLYL